MSNYDLEVAQKAKRAYEAEPIPVKAENFELADGGTRLVRYIGKDEKVVLPPSVRVVGGRAFSNNQTIKYVSMMNVEHIELAAFQSCSNLEFVTLGQKLRQIDAHAFYDCAKLDLVKLPKSVSTIIDGALANVGYVTIEKGSKYVSSADSSYVYDESCGRLIHVSNRVNGELTLPLFIRTIGDYSFRGCKDIQSLNLKDGLKEIQSKAFGLTKLSFIPLPNTLVKICGRAFEDSSIEALYLPESIREVDSKILYNAPVKRITVSQTEGDIKNLVGFKFAPDWNNIGAAGIAKTMYGVKPGEGQFVIKKGTLTSVKFVDGSVLVIPPGVKKIANGFIGGLQSDIKQVVLPEGLTEIQTKAFAGFSKLETINFPQSLIYIGDNAFDNDVALTGEIDLPRKLEYIGHGAFNWCPALNKVTIHSGICTVETSVFYGDNKCIVVLDGVKKSLFGSEPKGFKKGWDEGWERDKLLVWNK